MKCLLTQLSFCVGDAELDTSVDVPSMSGDDTPVHILITFFERSHRYSEDSCLLIICNGASVTRSVPGCFHHDGTQLISLSFAPVLCVLSKPRVVLTRDCHGSSVCCCYHLWSRQLNRVHCMLRKPKETKNWSCKMQRKKKFTWYKVIILSKLLCNTVFQKAAITIKEAKRYPWGPHDRNGENNVENRSRVCNI